jgi:hypothetical protein
MIGLSSISPGARERLPAIDVFSLLNHSPKAEELGISRDRFASAGSRVDYSTLVIGGHGYRVGLTGMVGRMRAVREADPSDGWIVERVERTDPTDGGLHPAFLLYIGTPPPLEFAGDDAPDRLQAFASAQRPFGVSLTIGGTGTPTDFDAARLTIKARADSDALVIHDDMFSPPDRFRPFSAGGLSVEGFTLEQRGLRWHAAQRIGDAVISVIAWTKEQAIYALASIRMALFNRLRDDSQEQISDDEWEFDNDDFAGHSGADKLSVIEQSTEDAGVAYRNRSDVLLPIDCNVRIGLEMKSLRFSGLTPALATRLAALNANNAR